jgi:hypothetical protein
MKSLIWSLVATLVAATLFVLGRDDMSETGMRWLGAAGGGVLALAGFAFGIFQRRSVPPLPKSLATSPLAERFFLDRRRAPRHAVSLPVQLAVNGHSYPATLVSVGARGALLRLRPEPGQSLHAQVGQPVRIADYPAGTLSRIGRSGVYVDFAVQFTPERSAVVAEPQPVETLARSGR